MKNYHDLDNVIAGLRKEYSFGALSDDDCARTPYLQFVEWFEAALKAKSISINAVSLATCGLDLKPASRIVLIKSFDVSGFVFYTNYLSEKASDLNENPKAEILFYWPEIERQVRISGKLKKISGRAADAYFKSRPRAAQLGAWTSRQSQKISNRQELEKRFQDVEKRFEGTEVPRPKSWGGYHLSPVSYEFWQGRANRLNDRILYKKSGKSWKRHRLQP